jgi:hypothetical protein
VIGKQFVSNPFPPFPHPGRDKGADYACFRYWRIRSGSSYRILRFQASPQISSAHIEKYFMIPQNRKTGKECRLNPKSFQKERRKKKWVKREEIF